MAQNPRLGLVLPSRGVLMHGRDPRELLVLAERAEASGAFAHVWVGDSLLAKPRIEAVATLAAVAARTQRVRLGVACMASLPARDPVLLACQWASLDVLSHGRTILAACLGGGGEGEPRHAREARNLGIGAGERARRLEENVVVMRRLWCEDRVTHEGEFHRLEDAALELRPEQRPPPVWMVATPRLGGAPPGRALRALDRVARLGDGWLTNAPTPTAFAALRERVLDAARALGRRFETLPCALYANLHIDEDRERALRGSQAFFDAYYGIRSTREAIEGAVALGPAEDCAERLRGFAEAGASDLLLRFCARDPHEQLRRCLDAVIPRLL